MLNIISVPIVGCKKFNAIVDSQVQGPKVKKLRRKIGKKILNEIVFYMSVYGRFERNFF